ncbi:MAG: hypothetical protein WDM79_16860 [Terricaulis sp.]
MNTAALAPDQDAAQAIGEPIAVSENLEIYVAPNDERCDVVCIAFGGYLQGLGVPVFEFMKSMTAAGLSAVFARDPGRAWYQHPIAGFGENPREMADVLSRVTAERFPGRRVVTIGNSMGGYAAIQFAALCGFHKAITFSPQAFISAEQRAAIGDTRWAAELDAITSPVIPDLRPLIEASALPVIVHVGGVNAFDRAHAAHLADLPSVIVREHAECGHSPTKWLRERGLLLPLILEGIAP